jgi:hypothetical protein
MDGHGMPQRLSRYKKYPIAGTEIKDICYILKINVMLSMIIYHWVLDLSHSSKYSVGSFLRYNVITLL